MKNECEKNIPGVKEQVYNSFGNLRIKRLKVYRAVYFPKWYMGLAHLEGYKYIKYHYSNINKIIHTVIL